MENWARSPCLAATPEVASFVATVSGVCKHVINVLRSLWWADLRGLALLSWIYTRYSTEKWLVSVQNRIWDENSSKLSFPWQFSLGAAHYSIFKKKKAEAKCNRDNLVQVKSVTWTAGESCKKLWGWECFWYINSSYCFLRLPWQNDLTFVQMLYLVSLVQNKRLWSSPSICVDFQLLGKAVGASSAQAVDGAVSAPRNARHQDEKRGTETKLFLLVGSVLI